MFADGVYEVISVYQGQPFCLEEHLQRLEHSLKAIHLKSPYSINEWVSIVNSLVEKNGSGNLTLYLQVTRGVSEIRDHGFPADISPTVFLMATPIQLSSNQFTLPKTGISVVTMEDIRWLRCDIKSISLLPNILSRQTALEKGANEAILVRDGRVTEAAAANVFIVKNDIILTPPLSRLILGGITRDTVISIARDQGYVVDERELEKSELYSADEIWVTSATRDIAAVTEIDGQQVSGGKPGNVWKHVATSYLQQKQALFGLQ